MASNKETKIERLCPTLSCWGSACSTYLKLKLCSVNSLSVYTKGYNDNRSVHQEYHLGQSKWTINKTVSMKYEVPNIITHRQKIVVTSSLETKIKHIKRTWISKISWLYNSLLYKAGNSKQKGSLIHISSPVNTQSKVQWGQICRPGKSVYSEADIFTHSPFSPNPVSGILPLNCYLWRSVFSTTHALSMKSFHTKGVTNPTSLK